MADTRRYWDGERWTDHIAPTESSAPETPSKWHDYDPATDTLAWTIAALPFVGAVVYIIDRRQGDVSLWVGLGGLALSVALAFADSAQLTRAGRNMGLAAWWTVIFPLLYLIDRTKRAKRTPAVPIVWAAGFVATVLAWTLIPETVAYSTFEVQREIEGQLEEQGYTAQVECSGTELAGRDGDEFDCSASEAGGASVPITVTLTESGWKWEVG